MRYLAAPWRGQKTGAFLDQRENRALRRPRSARPSARLLQLPRLVRAPPRAPRRPRHRARRVGARAHARRGELPAQRTDERRVRRGERVRVPARRANASALASTRSCSTRRRSRRREPRSAARSAATRRSTCARCGSSRPAACCSPRAARYHLTKPLFLEMLERGRGGQRAPHRATRDPRPALRSSRSADDPGDRVHQGRTARGARLTLRADRSLISIARSARLSLRATLVSMSCVASQSLARVFATDRCPALASSPCFDATAAAVDIAAVIGAAPSLHDSLDRCAQRRQGCPSRS